MATCRYCNFELEYESKKIGFHPICLKNYNNELNIVGKDLDPFYQICCPKDSKLECIKTTLEELAIIKNTTLKFFSKKAIYFESLQYSQIIDGGKKFFSNYNITLTEKLQNINWIIYGTTPESDLLNPYNLTLISEILDIEVNIEDIYGNEALKILTKEYSIDQLKNNQNIHYPHNDYTSEFNLFNQQKKLKNRFHLVKSEESYWILVSNISIDHVTAQYLAEYYQGYLMELENFENYIDLIQRNLQGKYNDGSYPYRVNFRDQRFQHYYDDLNIPFLKDSNYIQAQKLLLKQNNRLINYPVSSRVIS